MKGTSRHERVKALGLKTLKFGSLLSEGFVLYLRILTGKKHPQIELQRLQKV